MTVSSGLAKSAAEKQRQIELKVALIWLSADRTKWD
jgi:hypothetical protein